MCGGPDNIAHGPNYEYHHNVPVEVKKLDPRATMPEYKSAGACAFDMCACLSEGKSVHIRPGEQDIVPTGIATSIPFGFELRISPRSGQSAKFWISITNSPGIIDSDYRGELRIVLFNNHPTDIYKINHGDRICQVKLSLAPMAVFEEVEELDETERGEGRFGSTGDK